MDKNKQKPIPVLRKPESELEKIAIGIVNGAIYIDRYIEDDSMIMKVFQPLLWVSEENMAKIKLELGMIIADKTTKIGMVGQTESFEGYPSFSQCRLIHVSDLPILTKWLDHYTPESEKKNEKQQKKEE
jgi:hypothetical protein